MDFATTIAPGLRDVLLTGKAAEAVRRKEDKRGRVYDAVVMDAPADWPDHPVPERHQ